MKILFSVTLLINVDYLCLCGMNNNWVRQLILIVIAEANQVIYPPQGLQVLI